MRFLTLLELGGSFNLLLPFTDLFWSWRRHVGQMQGPDLWLAYVTPCSNREEDSLNAVHHYAI